MRCWLRPLLRFLRLALLALCALQGLAHAASYTFRNDSYAWETTSTALSWDRSCTSYRGDDDKATITFSGTFRFTFGGTAYSAVRVLTNGMLQFGADTGSHRLWDNTALPTTGTIAGNGGCANATPARLMMPYWTDLDPSRGSASVTWEQKGSAPNRYLVVSWNNVYEYNTSTPYTFQVILYENGEFKYQYANANATGANATIGVQVSSSDSTLYSFNSGYRTAGTAIRWGPPNTTPMRVAEYRFDEEAYDGSVNEATDSSGNRHDGVRLGTVDTIASGYLCRGLTVPANTSTATQAIDTALDVPNALGDKGSIAFWYRANSAWSGGADAQLFDASLYSGRSFHLVRRSGTLRFALTDSGGSTQTVDSPGQSFAAGTWVHVAATWSLSSISNSSTLKLYINGTLVGIRTTTTTGSLDQGLGTLFLGDSRNNITSANASINSADGRFDELRIYNYERNAVEVNADRTATHACPVTLHHLEIRHGSGSGLTCNPATLTLVACNDATCTSPYTGGVTGTLAASGTGMTVNWPAGAAFSIPAGSSTLDVALHLSTAGSVVVSASGLTPPPPNATTCNFGSPTCTFTASDSGLLFNVPHHVAEVAQTVSVSAVKKSDNSLACVPAFASVTRSIGFSCIHRNPASGSRAVRVGGSALNAANNAAAACDGSERAVSLAFNASGVASTTLQYADVGRMEMNAFYRGSGSEAGLVLSGTDDFIAAPASFAVSGVTAGPIRAGNAFSAQITARNSAGATTPNFGQEGESVNLSFSRSQPTGANARDGVFSGSAGAFSAGVATAANLAYTEVGRGDLVVALASGSYLGSGLSASGSTGTGGAVGKFIPHHFAVLLTPACGAFSYAGQPFAAAVTALNASGGITENYDGSAGTSPNFAQALSLVDAPTLGVGSFSGNAIAASAFLRGLASATPAYAFTDKQTPPRTLVLRASDADGVSSAGFAEGSTNLRSGRLRVANAVGSDKAALQLAVLAEYWGGASWLVNGADSCTTLPAAAVARSNVRDSKGAATAAWSSAPAAITITAGNGLLTMGAPAPAGPSANGTLDLALNLGNSAADQSCLATHPASTPANLPWLRSRQGACAATADRDPSARASFGVYAPETRKTVHVREIF